MRAIEVDLEYLVLPVDFENLGSASEVPSKTEGELDPISDPQRPGEIQFHEGLVCNILNLEKCEHGRDSSASCSEQHVFLLAL